MKKTFKFTLKAKDCEKEFKEGLVGFSGNKRNLKVTETVRFYSEEEDHLVLNGFENECINKDLCLKLMMNLEERDQKIIIAHFFKDMLLSIIGDNFNLTESRISQIISKGLIEMKNGAIGRRMNE